MLPQKQTEEENLSADERAEIEEAWVQESLRRMMELKNGLTEPIPSQDVHNYIKARIKAAREKS